MPKHRESPVRRRNPSGRLVWVARYTGPDGKRRSAGTFDLKRDAQDAIDRAYETPILPTTIGAYLEGWTDRHPRSERTNRTNQHRISRVLDAPIDGKTLAEFPMSELRRRHALELVDHMLRHQHRSPSGAVNILRALSAMLEDAITDELTLTNPFKGVRVRDDDPRAEKRAIPPRVFTFAELHVFAAHARNLRKGNYEPMLRTLIDCGLRLGEVLGLERRDLEDGMLNLRGNAHNGVFTPGNAHTKRHVRSVPVPPGLMQMLQERPARIDTPLLFPTPNGKLWFERNFYRDIWGPTRKLAKLDVRPHDCRHSYVTHMHAAGIDPADLADIAGHRVATMLGHYTHPLRASFDEVREIIG